MIMQRKVKDLAESHRIVRRPHIIDTGALERAHAFW